VVKIKYFLNFRIISKLALMITMITFFSLYETNHAENEKNNNPTAAKKIPDKIDLRKTRFFETFFPSEGENYWTYDGYFYSPVLPEIGIKLPGTLTINTGEKEYFKGLSLFSHIHFVDSDTTQFESETYVGYVQKEDGIYNIGSKTTFYPPDMTSYIDETVIEPPALVLPYYLEIGKKWAFTTTSTRKFGPEWSYLNETIKHIPQIETSKTQENWEITGKESIQVPVGTFDCYIIKKEKVSQITDISDPKPPDLFGKGTGHITLKITETVWFSPEVGIVKISEGIKTFYPNLNSFGPPQPYDQILTTYHNQFNSSTAKEQNDKIVTVDTVEDLKTKLTWQRCPVGRSGKKCKSGDYKLMDWPSAMDYCKNLQLAGRKWRLPTKEELKSLIFCSNGKDSKNIKDSIDYANDEATSCGEGGTYSAPTINKKLFPNSAGQNSFYWASDVKFLEDTSSWSFQPWTVWFVNGMVSQKPKNLTVPVRCVSN
jgi:uncharacterized protein (TIGR02145 family)